MPNRPRRPFVDKQNMSLQQRIDSIVWFPNSERHYIPQTMYTNLESLMRFSESNHMECKQILQSLNYCRIFVAFSPSQWMSLRGHHIIIPGLTSHPIPFDPIFLTHLVTLMAIQLHWRLPVVNCSLFAPMIRENRQLVTNEPVEFEK